MTIVSLSLSNFWISLENVLRGGHYLRKDWCYAGRVVQRKEIPAVSRIAGEKGFRSAVLEGQQESLTILPSFLTRMMHAALGAWEKNGYFLGRSYSLSRWEDGRKRMR
jgi:hypothetical protein